MARILIIGIGNPLREDDAVGRLAARQLAARYAGDENVTVISCHQLTPELAEAVAGSDLVLFLDASRTGKPGELKESVLLPTGNFNHLDPHIISPQNLLAVSEQLYGRDPRALLLTVAGRRFGIGEALSWEARQGMDRLVEYAAAIIAGFGHGGAPA